MLKLFCLLILLCNNLDTPENYVRELNLLRQNPSEYWQDLSNYDPVPPLILSEELNQSADSIAQLLLDPAFEYENPDGLSCFQFIGPKDTPIKRVITGDFVSFLDREFKTKHVGVGVSEYLDDGYRMKNVVILSKVSEYNGYIFY